jgi:AcrR family transcriptional regulator
VTCCVVRLETGVSSTPAVLGSKRRSPAGEPAPDRSYTWGVPEPADVPIPQRNADATRQAIRDAALRLFCQLGFDGASTRQIALAAGVDPRLITRYFGSKEGLFAAVVAVAFEKPLLMAPGENGIFARALLGDEPAEPNPMLLTLRSAANPRAAEIIRAHLEADYHRRLTEALPGDDASGRAALLISICAGVLLNRNVLGVPALRDAHVERLVPYLEAALEVIARGDLPPREPEG